VHKEVENIANLENRKRAAFTCQKSCSVGGRRPIHNESKRAWKNQAHELLLGSGRGKFEITQGTSESSKGSMELPATTSFFLSD